MNFNCKKSVCEAPEVLDPLKSYRSEKFENSNYTHTHTHTHTQARVSYAFLCK
jgi:hypothetical protein